MDTSIRVPIRVMLAKDIVSLHPFGHAIGKLKITERVASSRFRHEYSLAKLLPHLLLFPSDQMMTLG
jgi:hypothetical protein